MLSDGTLTSIPPRLWLGKVAKEKLKQVLAKR